jgi:hypothetical protein
VPAPLSIHRYVRATLVLMGLGLVAVFGVAIWLDPYDEYGVARSMETHRQLGLPECTFKTLTQKPCPSCGMTTSFALFIRGDIWPSLKANCVGTFLAACCLAMVPYAFYCGARGRYIWLISMDWLLPRLIVVFCVLMLLRWAVVLWLTW